MANIEALKKIACLDEFGGCAGHEKTAQASHNTTATPAPSTAPAAGAGLWDSVMSKIDEAKKWYDDPANSSWKPIVAGGLGALGGGLLSKLVGGEFGKGALVGGLGGLGYSAVDWNALKNSLGKKVDKNQNGAVAPGGGGQGK